MTPRVRVVHPDLRRPVEAARGEVLVLDPAVGDVVVRVVCGNGPRGGAHVEVDGRRLRPRGLARRVRRGLAVVSGAPVATDVTVRDHLVAVVGVAAAERLLADAPLLADRGPDPAGVLSGGERRVLAWLRAVAVAPRVVLLDRAAEGLDTATVAWAGGVVADWAADEVAVLVRPGRAEEHDWATGDGTVTSPGD